MCACIRKADCASRAVLGALVAAWALVTGACVDTSLPDLTAQLGGGPTDGAYCNSQDTGPLPPETLRVHVIDVGQGDAILVETPYYGDPLQETRYVLIDTGPSGTIPGAAGAEVLIEYLGRVGVNLGDRLDAVVITHAHEDHYGGLPAVAASYDIRRYVDPGFDASSFGFLEARAAAEDAVLEGGGEVDVPAAPQLASLYHATDLFGSNVTAHLVWSATTPPGGSASSPTNSDVNNTSVVFSLFWAGRRVLLMGDAEQEVEEELLHAASAGEVVLAADVLKVGHHGSNTSSTQPFLDAVFAGDDDASKWAVISSGRRSFGGTQLPSPEAVARLGEALPEHHLLSTENRDDDKSSSEAAGDDHVIITIGPQGATRACYNP